MASKFIQAGTETGDFSPELIDECLARVLVSSSFAHVERPSRFLRYLVQGALKGEAETLKESVLGVEVFGRPASWDPRLDPVVRQEAARLRKRVSTHYQSEGAAEPVRIVLRTSSYVPRQIELAQKLDSGSNAILADKALIAYFDGHRDDARATIKQMIQVDPSFSASHRNLSGMYFVRGDYVRYLQESILGAKLERRETAFPDSYAFPPFQASPAFDGMKSRFRRTLQTGLNR